MRSFIHLNNILVEIMAKVCSDKRLSAVEKRKQKLAKRHWWQYRDLKAQKNVKSQRERSSKSSVHELTRQNVIGRQSAYLGTLLAASTLLNKVRGTVEVVGQTAERNLRFIGLVLSQTASLPLQLQIICMSLCYSALNRSLVAAREGKAKVYSTLSLSMYNGYSQFKKVVDFVGDVIFPSRPYKRKLDEMYDRLEQVENELKKLKSEAVLNQQPIRDCSIHVPCAPLPVTTFPPVPVCPPPPAPPPPPPPPPPPICKPPEAITLKKKKKVGEADAKNTSKVGVTLEDLKSVKLRKVVHDEEFDKDNKENSMSSPLTFGLRKRNFLENLRGTSEKQKSSTCHPFISLKDIKKVSLRKTHFNSAKKKSPGQCKIAFLKTNLRKVHAQRSPGGTPFSDKPKECHGEGLTPIMTRALQRKFKFAHPASPVENFNETNSFLEKTLTRSSPRMPLNCSSTQSPFNRHSPRSPFARSSPRSPLARTNLQDSSPRSPMTRIKMLR